MITFWLAYATAEGWGSDADDPEQIKPGQVRMDAAESESYLARRFGK